MKKDEIICMPIPRYGQYEVVLFQQEANRLLELRVSHTAIANGPCELSEIDIHKWLEQIGSEYVEQSKEFETILILAKDVVNGTLITGWENLNREVNNEV